MLKLQGRLLNPMSHTDQQLELLVNLLFCTTRRVNDMVVSDLDDFVVGRLAGPEMIVPSEWLPVV